MKIPKIIGKLFNQYFRFIVGGIVVAILAAGYFLLLSPKIADVRSTQGAAQKNAEAELKTQQSYLASLKQSNAKFDQVLPVSIRNKINNFIPSEPDFPGLLLTLKNIVSQAQMTLDTMSVGQSGETAVASTTGTTATTGKSGTTSAQAATVSGINVKTQDVSISISGGKTYQDFKKLLSLLESSQRLFDVISVNYSGPTSTTGSTAVVTTSTEDLKWSIVLRTYYFPPR